LRRVLRIVPLYYSLLVLFTYVLPALYPTLGHDDIVQAWRDDAPWYFAFLANFLVLPLHDFPMEPLAVAWSLAVEEQFYIVWPVVMLVVSKWRPVTVFLALIFGAIVLRVYLLANDWTEHALYVFTPARMDPLLVGAITAVLRWRGQLSRLWPARTVLVVTAVILIVVEGLSMWLEEFTSAVGPFELVRVPLYYTLIAVFFGAVLTHCLKFPSSKFSLWLCEPWLRYLGLWSYGIYLTHNFINHGLIYLNLTFGVLGLNLAGLLLQYILTITLSILAGAACYYGIERPFLSLRRYGPA
jgi:peptidoglycan/LPS O-acetylase OafA/YrhL